MASSQYPSDGGDEFKPYPRPYSSPPPVDCTLSLGTPLLYTWPPSVDCTLSLGTPSTRRSCPPSFPGNGNTNNGYNEHHRHSGGSSSSIIFSNLQSQYSNSSTYNYGTSGHHTIISNVKHTANNASSGGNPPVVRCCAICDTTATPLWRKGPNGPKTLCNACGIRFKKVERRAKAAADATNPLGGGGIEMGKPTNPERGSTTSWRRRKSPAGSGTKGSLSSSPSLAD